MGTPDIPGLETELKDRAELKLELLAHGNGVIDCVDFVLIIGQQRKAVITLSLEYYS